MTKKPNLAVELYSAARKAKLQMHLNDAAVLITTDAEAANIINSQGTSCVLVSEKAGTRSLRFIWPALMFT